MREVAERNCEPIRFIEIRRPCRDERALRPQVKLVRQDAAVEIAAKIATSLPGAGAGQHSYCLNARDSSGFILERLAGPQAGRLAFGLTIWQTVAPSVTAVQRHRLRVQHARTQAARF
jgi:hypothetical protein